MDELILSSLMQQLVMDWLLSSGSPFENTTFHVFQNSTVVLNNQTQLGAFTESTFQGYAPITGQNPLEVWRDEDLDWHLKFPSQEWQVANGFPQAGTVTVSTAVTMTGTIIMTVTAAGMTGSPRAVTVNVLDLDSATVTAGKIAAALNADADVSSFFAATSSGAVVTLTALTAAAHDSTMNLALALGTATGPAPVATWTETQAGVAPVAPDETAAGIYATDSTNTQYRGAAKFATPINLTAAYQMVHAWPDIPYGG